MKDLVQCTVSRDDFQRWLDWGNAPLTICTGEKAVTMLLKIEKKPVDYLYQTAVEADGSISWNSGLTFCGVHREALDRFFGGNEPDGQFHSGYALDQLPEAAFLAWLQNPEGFIETEAEQYIKINQEKFLLQFLKNDALLAEYQALIQDPNNPLHRVKAISEAIKTSGAKTVTVTVQKMERNCPSGQGLLRCGDVTTPTAPVISPPLTRRSLSACLAATSIIQPGISPESPMAEIRFMRPRPSKRKKWRRV